MGLFNLVHARGVHKASGGVRERPEAIRVSFNTLLTAVYTYASLA